MWVGGVRVILPDDNGRILMVKQHHEGRDIWMVPGGGIEDGETAIQAAKREVLEETGLEIEVTGFAWHIEEVSEKRGQRFVNYMIGRITGGEAHLGYDPEFSEDEQVLRDIGFMSEDDMRKLENVFPSYLCDEVWELIEKKRNNMCCFKLR